VTPLGKSLVFHLKYMAEMNRLYGGPVYEGEEPDLTGLDDAERVREMARIVGAAAYQEAADFVELCGKGIEDHFIRLGITTVAYKTKRAKVVKNWTWSATVQVPSVSGRGFLCGVWVTAPPEVRISIEKDVCGVVVPFLWLRGGRKAEDAVWKILDGWPHSRGGEGLVAGSGDVALACIPIKAQPTESLDVDREQLIAEVMKTIARIGAEQTKAIASFAAGPNEPDES
jgi:hypothetical protein